MSDRRLILCAGVALAALAAPVAAQDHDHDHGAPPPAAPQQPTPHDHGAMDHAAMGHDVPPVQNYRMSNAVSWRYFHSCQILDENGDPIMASCVRSAFFADGSGTSRQPGHDGHHQHGNIRDGSFGTGWTIMAHGAISTQFTSHGGPRGDDKAYVTSMGMLMGERETGWGTIQLKSMFSLEPLMKNRGYPNLFATGETAGGVPLVDRQHPHDLFMELAARVDVDLSPDASLFVYGGPVGEPALGPSAFMHRRSAALNPEPPITHHYFDSTHITYGVATAGVSTRRFQIEGSVFTGREPDERRWNIEKPRMDSWSMRATFTPRSDLSVQASYGALQEPEAAIHPGEDERRFTASAAYSGDVGDGDLSAMVAFSAKKRDDAATVTAWLAEAHWAIDDRHNVFARVENVANNELFPDHSDPLHDQTFRVSKFQLGYAWQTPLNDDESLNLALGGSVAAYAKPDVLDAVYGKSPLGATIFARITLGH